MITGVRQCPACGLPIFTGLHAYAEDACKCNWQHIPRSNQPKELAQRVTELEQQVAYLMRMDTKK